MINILNIAVATQNVILCLIGGIMTNKYGRYFFFNHFRKPLLFYGTFVVFTSLIVLSICSYLHIHPENYNHFELDLSIIIFIHVYLIGFYISLGPITFVIITY